MTRILRARWVALAVALIVASPASAFYFRGWPGDGVPRDKNLVSPNDRFIDTEVGRISNRDPNHDHDEPTTTSATPEPGGVVLAAIGIGVVGVLRRMRK